MKARHSIFLVGLLLCFHITKSHAFSITDSLSFTAVLLELKTEMEQRQSHFTKQMEVLEIRLFELNQILKNEKATDRQLIAALLEKNAISEQITMTERAFQIGLDKTRYRKGLDLLKLMYEKILGLDHHFHSLQTWNSISQLSNPNAYSEFQKTSEVLSSRLSKKNAMQMPPIMQTNPFLSASFTLIASILGVEEQKQKEEDLEKIACILDFTVRMNADLNTIYYETEFLKEGNESLKEACDRLFKDYSKIIGYTTPLEECRKEDDWETVYVMLDDYILELETLNTQGQSDLLASRKFARGVANLEFSVDRLLQFLNEYSNFVSQGEKYYLKFEVIASNYQNEENCLEQLPHQFATLKQEIKFSIEKFRDAYFVAELKGSKLKDLLYGSK